eukprot:gnl/TRDRNA2_/TRDRNA2_31148_c0_seq1.p1 gnl/TRDRNA2_/TRDRNA2_31148_c0~~gnl/TRDRNA2_/TRDRNA2_31148_c0_seq1.p1  ORF type:complete len:217 (-),score=36.05 gnl/TRDRNA2_/TRDRNA2_31148_c0_seq1:123-773(-)
MLPSGTSCTLYVGDLQPEVTEDMLREIFESVGPISSIQVFPARWSLCYAYVSYHASSDAERAFTLNYSCIKGRPCRIMWKHQDSATWNVYAKNLDKNMDDKALYDTFSLFGDIITCKVATDLTGESRGYGFVCYSTAGAAQQAIERVSGMQVGATTIFVDDFKNYNYAMYYEGAHGAPMLRLDAASSAQQAAAGPGPEAPKAISKQQQCGDSCAVM